MSRVFISAILCVVAFQPAYAGEWRFARDLQFGSRGPDVFALQRLLNERAETRVANTGAGSPSKETNYFGAATARSVAVFQREHAIKGELGVVGPKTLAALNVFLYEKKTPLRPDQSVGAPPLKLRAGEETKKENPNSRNLEQFLEIVKRVGGEQGRSAEELEKLAGDMRSLALATTTDFLTQFVSESRKNVRTISWESPWRHRVTSLFQKLTDALMPRADAQIPGFGGMVVYVFPCTCSGNWLVGMVPLSVPPLALMTHYTGSQAFLNFNAPFTLFMLGSYIPQGAPCLMYAVFGCFPLPSQAQTVPMLGTS